jgi:hypothetical protein
VPFVSNPAGRGARLFVLAALLLAASRLFAQEPSPFGDGQLQAMPGARGKAPESRIGQVFWARPAARPFSVDFFDSPDLHKRVPLERTRRFAVLGLIRAGERETDPLLYMVRFGPGEHAVIPVHSFEAHLYVDPPPQSETRLKSDLYLSPQAYFFSIKSIFTEDPDVLWERIRNLGPTRIGPPAPARPPAPEGGLKKREPSRSRER